jgi:hypothetical protein
MPSSWRKPGSGFGLYTLVLLGNNFYVNNCGEPLKELNLLIKGRKSTKSQSDYDIIRNSQRIRFLCPQISLETMFKTFYLMS